MEESVKKFKHLGELARTVSAIIVVTAMIMGPTWRYLLMPILVSQVSSAMAQDIEKKIDDSVKRRTEPINEGLKAIIVGNINRLEERIKDLEYTRDFLPTQWTNELSRELLSLQRELEVQRRALSGILQSERN